MRARCIIGFGFVVIAGVWGQPTFKPEFEVASVRAASSDFAPRLSISDAGTVDLPGISLVNLICRAYRLPPFQISAPNWALGARFDVRAKLPEGATIEQVPEMIQALLKERFSLSAHYESRVQKVYVLSVAKQGPNLPSSTPTSALGGGTKAGDSSEAFGIEKSGDGSFRVGKVQVSMLNERVRYAMSAETLPRFTEFLSGLLGTLVFDTTDLKGMYDIVIDIPLLRFDESRRPASDSAPVVATAAKDPADTSLEKIQAAIQPLGLRLEARSDPIQILVVDHLERSPTDN